jgi:hypothetical protein
VRPHAHASTAGNPNWKRFHTVWLVVIVAGICVVGAVVPHLADFGPSGDPNHVVLWSWLVIAALLVAFVALAGDGITGLARGALIDERNQMSLSRLQMLMWTILILSAYLSAALANIGTGQLDPLTIAIPKELWAALGIGTISLVGSPLILDSEKEKPQPAASLEKTKAGLAAQGVPEDGISAVGNVVQYGQPADAQWADMFRGDKVGNGSTLDLSKIQMFFFTIILVIMYGFALGGLFNDLTAKITAFPALDAGAIALLGISHAGYLSAKKIT